MFRLPWDASRAAATSVVSPGSGTPMLSTPMTSPTTRYASTATPGGIAIACASRGSPMHPWRHRAASGLVTGQLDPGDLRVVAVLRGNRRRLAGERLGDALQRGGDFGRDHPEGVAGTLGQLGQHLQVLVGEQLRVRVVAVDRLEHRVDRLRLALGP